MEIRRNSKFSSGFSLIELAIVIAIIAVVAAVAGPSLLAWRPNLALRRAARDLYSNMQRVKIEAIKRNASVNIVFNIGGNSYAAFSGGNPINLSINLQDYGHGIAFGMPPGGLKNAGIDTSPGAPPVSYAGGTVTFDARGMTPATQGFVYLLNNNGAGFMVGTPGTTGIIQIRKWFGGANWE